jgi:sulfur-oxidizing protein SoxB
MTTRREMLQAGAAAAAIIAAEKLGGFRRALAQQRLTEADLLKFTPQGNVTILHVADLHAQLRPVYLREPSVNTGFGEARGVLPHLTGIDLLHRYEIPPKSAAAYAFSSEDFSALAKSYGRLGGLDRMATVVKAIRAERGQDRVLLLDGGDTLQGSLGSYRTKGQDVVDCFKLLKPDAMTGHWEFTYGEARVRELVAELGYPFLALNVRDAQRQEPVFQPYKLFDKGGIKIAVLGQAYPHTPATNPRWMIPNWAFGIREDDIRANIEKARKEGASLIVLLSHNGFDADRKLARQVPGIDVILTAHGHDALPQPLRVGKTLLVASGSHGKFVSRLDLDVRPEGLQGFRYKLIPLFSDVIRTDPEMKAAIERARAPFAAELSRVVGQTASLLYRRGTFSGSFDDLICAAMMSERDAEIAFSPGFRWGTSVPPNLPITVEDIHNATAITYPQVYRTTMSGERIKAALEDIADNVCNPDPYLQQGGDMVRCGGLGYTLDVSKPAGRRISGLTHLKTRKPIEASKDYVAAGWASLDEKVEGPPIWDVVERHVAREKTVRIKPAENVKVTGA